MDYDFSESYKPADAASGIRRCVCWQGLEVSLGPLVSHALEDRMDGGGSGMQRHRSLACREDAESVQAERDSHWEEEDGILPSSSPLV